MLDLDSCPKPNSRWADFTWSITYRFTRSLSLPARITLAALLILGLAWLIWFIRQPHEKSRIQQWLRYFRWNRRRTKAIVALTLVVLIGTSPPGIALVTQALTSQIPADSGAKADAIVVLGRGWRFMGDRIDVAATLWQAKRAPRIFASGGDDARWIMRQLLEKGLPNEALSGEACSATTAENAQFAAKIMRPQGVKHIILVTDAPHMVRSLLTFQSAGFEVIPHTNALPTNLGYRESAALIIREYAGILSYVLKGRFNEPAVVKNAHISTLNQ